MRLAMLLLGVLSASCALAEEMTVSMYDVSTPGKQTYVGKVTIEESKYGLLFMPNLTNLPAGVHGFHVHVNPSCADGGMAAGEHLDPAHTGKHLGPYDDAGHLGDLPAIYVAANGAATTPVLAPRLTQLSQLKNHSLMIHVHGDNYSDKPEKLGGGGKRMVCGVME